MRVSVGATTVYTGCWFSFHCLKKKMPMLYAYTLKSFDWACSRLKSIQRERTQHPAHQVKIAVVMRTWMTVMPVPAQANVKLVSMLSAYQFPIFFFGKTYVCLIWYPPPPPPSSSPNKNAFSTILPFHHFHVSAAKGKKIKKKKRASKLTALEMLEEKNKQKADLKEKELEQRRLELEFQKRKYEYEAKERKERLNQELEERRLLFALLKDKLWYVSNQDHLYFEKFIYLLSDVHCVLKISIPPFDRGLKIGPQPSRISTNFHNALYLLNIYHVRYVIALSCNELLMSKSEWEEGPKWTPPLWKFQFPVERRWIIAGITVHYCKH